MVEVKKIELKYGDGGWIFHHINEITELLDEYGMGWIEQENEKFYFKYHDADTVSELLNELVGSVYKIEEDETSLYFCSSWAPMTFPITWNPKEQVGYAYGDFKFKNVKDFRMFQMVFYKYKRQSVQNCKDIAEWRKNPNVSGCWGDWQMYKIAEFALSYCDYTDEEREKIKKIYILENKND